MVLDATWKGSNRNAHRSTGCTQGIRWAHMGGQNAHAGRAQGTRSVHTAHGAWNRANTCRGHAQGHTDREVSVVSSSLLPKESLLEIVAPSRKKPRCKD
eukprot:CAMPEP_0174357508 /NCGR_PEP_ID=MMETSP0811_2-20130205/36474_1 /TAXON_ID=73025 ORGANISM="Eutreptiella gymnastica-like, Strain CCMP1594" /NCGR_SAMPLE_ID=MMETSP0811_2 /ASSEMBLY_ACC=CAM_ASM_000667 /LENGTH=98 /DNA_ID=CAMNT_0015490397 /DNA_START=331 /DNA_END=624 /DNA_ORIENTATION=+